MFCCREYSQSYHWCLRECDVLMLGIFQKLSLVSKSVQCLKIGNIPKTVIANKDSVMF